MPTPTPTPPLTLPTPHPHPHPRHVDVINTMMCWLTYLIKDIRGLGQSPFGDHWYHVNSSPPGQNGHHLADDVFKSVNMNKKFCISIQGPIHNGSNWQYSSIGSDNGSAPTRRQAIIWTNADPVYRRIYAALGGDELKLISISNDQSCNTSMPLIQPSNYLKVTDHLDVFF